jgi:hypothetical protein
LRVDRNDFLGLVAKKNKTKKVTPEAPKVKPVNYREKVIGAAFFTLAAGVLSVSLPHLAEGMRETLWRRMTGRS